MNTVNFENNEILTSVMLSDMVYLENRRLHEIKQEEERILPIIHSLGDDFLVKYNIDRKELETEEDLERVLDFAYEEILPKLQESHSYQEVIKKRHYFHWERGDQKSGYEFVESPRYEIEDTAKEIKKNLLQQLFKLSIFRNNPNMIEAYQNVLDKQKTSIDIEYEKNSNLLETKEDTDALWGKFEKVVPNEAIVKKYSTPYETPTSLNIVAEFNNGFIDVGRVNGFKDASFMVGYVRNENNEKVLHVVFRGTEGKAMPTSDYFLQHYPNMERQYQRIAPILEDIITQELEIHKKNNPNSKMKVVFSGHSLGAALAEKALDKHKDNEDIAYKGFLIANPGSFHYLQKAINGLDALEKKIDKMPCKEGKFKVLGCDAIKSSIKLGKDVLTAGVIFVKMGLFLGVISANYAKGSINMGFKPLNENPNMIDKVVKYSTFNSAKMLSAGMFSLIATFGDLFNTISSPFLEYKKADDRAVTINHIHDNIPQAGKALFQNENENKVDLSKDAPRITTSSIGYQLAFHKTYNYYMELKEKASFGKIFTPKPKDDLEVKVRSKDTVMDSIRKIKESLNPAKLVSSLGLSS